MAIRPFKDRFGKASALTGSATSGLGPTVGVSSSYDLINQAAGGMLTAPFDRFRQGVSVVSRRYIRRDSPSTVNITNSTAVIGCLPILTSNGFDGERIKDIHGVEVRDFGQSKLFKDHEPYEDLATMRISTKIESTGTTGSEGAIAYVTSAYGGAIAYINDSGMQQYPVILSNVSMKYPDQFDGVIEPFPIREVISNRSAETPFVAHKIRAHIMDGNIEETYGSDSITQIMAITGSHEVDPFIDSAETAMSDGTFTLFAPGFTSDIERLSPPFLDRGSPGAEGKERFCKILVGTGSLRDFGLIDSHHKSAGSGFTYENNIEGTDSIAFGGLKR